MLSIADDCETQTKLHTFGLDVAFLQSEGSGTVHAVTNVAEKLEILVFSSGKSDMKFVALRRTKVHELDGTLRKRLRHSTSDF
jgi:hypothetical protein